MMFRSDVFGGVPAGIGGKEANKDSKYEDKKQTKLEEQTKQKRRKDWYYSNGPCKDGYYLENANTKSSRCVLGQPKPVQVNSVPVPPDVIKPQPIVPAQSFQSYEGCDKLNHPDAAFFMPYLMKFVASAEAGRCIQDNPDCESAVSAFLKGEGVPTHETPDLIALMRMKQKCDPAFSLAPQQIVVASGQPPNPPSTPPVMPPVDEMPEVDGAAAAAAATVAALAAKAQAEAKKGGFGSLLVLGAIGFGLYKLFK